MVWLDNKNIKVPYLSRKIAPTISDVLGPLTYRLKLPTQWKIHDVFHASLLTPYSENDVYGPNFPQPPPDLVNDELEWELEDIVNHRL